jgi:transposase
MAAVVNFEQIVQRGCGLDVHKQTVVATIDGVGLTRETREFRTTTSSLKELKEWLEQAGVTHVVMESTGVYWKPVYHVLEPSGMTVWIVNARHVKYVPGHKTDKRDSKWLCKLLLAGLLKPSFIPPREQRELRDLTRYRRKMIEQIASEKNRVIRILEDCNIKLSSVLSDTHGVVGTKIIDKLCKNGNISKEDIEEVYHGKLQASREEIYEACEGLVTEHHVFMLQAIKKDISSCEAIISDITARIKKMLASYDNVLELLKEVPGLSTKSIEDLIAEIGLDMSVFPTEKHLASWCGVAPGNNESAGKKKVDALHMATNKSRQ